MSINDHEFASMNELFYIMSEISRIFAVSNVDVSPFIKSFMNRHFHLLRFNFRGFWLAAGMAALLLVGCEKETIIRPVVYEGGCLPGLFSVSDTTQVRFSQGNLQWSATGSHATADSSAAGTWRFAKHQYDMIGNDNSNISESYTGWIDLFGWATSGYHNSHDIYNRVYHPYSSTVRLISDVYNCFGYGPSTFRDDPNLTGTSANYDWGVYNAISNGGNRPGLWRTLSWYERDYLMCARHASTVGTTTDARYALIRVFVGTKFVNGLLLFPDRFSWPSAAGKVPTAINGCPEGTGWSDVPYYTLFQFAALEATGCVFLPAAGLRNGTSVDGVGEYGWYWTSTYDSDKNAGCTFFSYCEVADKLNFRFCGQALRLVQDKMD